MFDRSRTRRRTQKVFPCSIIFANHCEDICALKSFVQQTKENIVAICRLTNELLSRKTVTRMNLNFVRDLQAFPYIPLLSHKTPQFHVSGCERVTTFPQKPPTTYPPIPKRIFTISQATESPTSPLLNLQTVFYQKHVPKTRSSFTCS